MTDSGGDFELNLETIGAPTGENVTIAVDYAIIRHFSEHLYGSPNKAIEELVSNGYDALAAACRVYIPGSLVSNHVLVWDAGTSMGLQELKDLWIIARSPKASVPGRVVESDGVRRYMIGKFGIGKLASYALGSRITHYCHLGGKYLMVSVDYDLLTSDISDADGDARTKGTNFETPIIELTRDEARGHLAAMFGSTPDSFGEMFDRPSWTLAAIDKLRDVSLTPKRLAWVLGNGMPLRPDFRLFVNDVEVVPRLSEGASQTWTLGEPKVSTAIDAAWLEAASSLDPRTTVAGVLVRHLEEPPVGTPNLCKGPEIEFPNLGRVRAEIRLFSSTLLSNDPDRPRSYGFFVMVRGRLVNPEDAQLLLPDPSFATFYRSQFVIEADGLDVDLLADRERLKEQTPRMRELAVLQRALYRTARAELERIDSVRAYKATTESILPVDSRELFREPLTALLLSRGDTDESFSLSRPAVLRESLDESEPLSELSSERGGFIVNAAHPFYSSVRSKIGSGQKAVEILRVLDLFAVSERLLEGYLFDIGLLRSDIERVMDWRDRLFRALAIRYEGVSSEVVSEVIESSFTGGPRFEAALAQLFQTMGFVATKDGKSGEKDILVVAPVGPGHQRFTVEAKGSKKPVVNDASDVDISAAHRTDAKATHSLIVAREFAGFGSGKDDPMILKQLREVSGVSIVTTEALIALAAVAQTHSYPLELLLPVLVEIESPHDKLLRIQRLADPLASFDVKGLLDEVWLRQRGEAVGDVVSARHIWQVKYKDVGMSFEDFRTKLVALETLSDGLLQFKSEQNDVHIRQSPDNVVRRMQRAMGDLG